MKYLWLFLLFFIPTVPGQLKIKDDQYSINMALKGSFPYRIVAKQRHEEVSVIFDTVCVTQPSIMFLFFTQNKPGLCIVTPENWDERGGMADPYPCDLHFDIFGKRRSYAIREAVDFTKTAEVEVEKLLGKDVPDKKTIERFVEQSAILYIIRDATPITGIPMPVFSDGMVDKIVGARFATFTSQITSETLRAKIFNRYVPRAGITLAERAAGKMCKNRKEASDIYDIDSFIPALVFRRSYFKEDAACAIQ